ncbi:hypothetical protein EVAR_28526_1 [Eumeta japonica]|uniref:Uncharacterized protein n=1 Tax=Eumeta variegata TaxID=151549 RepID=A0A4C1WQB4_EUMVA|nr:hypothetical protein EVAR_28526_1 [Eumeta japonica]
MNTIQTTGASSFWPRRANGAKGTIAGFKSELTYRDQDMLCNDLGIAGIPEEKKERSMHLTLRVATKLSVSLDERDVFSVECVGMARCLDMYTDSGAADEPRAPRLTTGRGARAAQHCYGWTDTYFSMTGTFV